KGKVLQRKMRTDWNVDKTTQRQTHQGDLTTKNTKATKKIQNHLKEVRDLRVLRGDQRSPRACRSSRGSSKLQLPNDTTNFRRYCSRFMSIFHSRQAKKSSVKENESTFSSSSMTAVWCASHRCSAARTAAPSTLRNPYIFVFTSSRNWRMG